MKILKSDLKRAAKTKEIKKILSAIEAEDCVDIFFETIEDALAEGEDVAFCNLGKFTKRQRNPRDMYDFQQKKMVKINPKADACFVAAKKIKEHINQ